MVRVSDIQASTFSPRRGTQGGPATEEGRFVNRMKKGDPALAWVPLQFRTPMACRGDASDSASHT